MILVLQFFQVLYDIFNTTGKSMQLFLRISTFVMNNPMKVQQNDLISFLIFLGRRWSPEEFIWSLGCSYMVVIWFYCYSFLHRQFSSFPYRVEAWDSRGVTRRFSKTIQDSILTNARFRLDDLFWTDGKYRRKILWVSLSAVWVLWSPSVTIHLIDLIAHA